MDLNSALTARRSIRKYKNRMPEKDKLRMVLKGAMYAPSAVNKQPWHFLVIDERDLLDRIMEVHPYASMLSTAPLAILVCGDTELHNGPGYWAVDCAAATQNLLLAAHGQGLGTCWVGIHPVEERKEAMSELFLLPDTILPFALVAMGYPDQERPIPERFIAERILQNRWGQQYDL